MKYLAKYPFILLALLMLTYSLYSNAAASIEDFKSDLLSSLENKDSEIFESLLFPNSLEKSRKAGLVKHQRKIQLILNQKAPSSYQSYTVQITNIETDNDYDISTNTLEMFGLKKAYFPIKLEKRLTIYVSEGDAASNGEWKTPLMSQVLTKYKGGWYMVWPSEIK